MRKALYILVVQFLAIINSIAQTPKYYSLGTEEGILGSHIDYVFIDSYGYVWQAAYDGIQRWDGITGYNYHYQKNNPNSLPNNISNTIYEDQNHDIWLGTISGLCKFERKTGIIHRIHLGNKNLPINAIVQASNQSLWIGTSNGLCQIDTKSLKVTWPNTTLASLSIFALTTDHEHNTWVGTFEEGVFKLDQNNVIRQQFNLQSEPSIVSNKIRTLKVDTKDNLWIGTMDKGISVVHLPSNQHFNIQHFGNKTNSNGGFDEIRVIYEDKHKDIWVGVVNQPLYKYNPGTRQLIPQIVNSENHAGKSASGIFSITEDKFGNKWLGTHGMGLFYTNAYKNKIAQFGSKSQLKSLNNHLITSMVVDDAGNVWAGTDGAGLLKTNPQGNTSVLTTQHGLSSNAIHHLNIDRDGILWISTWGGGIMSINTKNQKITTYTHQPKDKYSILNDNSKVILPDEKLVWIGTHGDGIAILEKSSGKIFHYKNNNGRFPFNLQEPAWVNHIFKDAKNRIWVSTCFGLYMIQNHHMKSFHVADKHSNLANDYINMVAEDQEHKIWLVGEDGGLQYFDEIKNQFKTINQSSLPSCIKSIVFDNQNNCWLGTNIGIILYNTSNHSATVFNQQNGFQGPHFFHKSVYKDVHNNLFFGGLNGYNKFKPNDLQFHEQDLNLRFENVFLQGEGPDSTLQIIENETIEIPYQYRFANLSFSIPDQFAAKNLKIAFQIKGLNNAWIPLKNGTRNIALTGLNPDQYVLSMQYSVDGINWITFKNNLTINILPPWWKTYWFKTLVVVLCLVGTIIVYQIRTAGIRKRNELLKELVKERTAALSESNLHLMEKNDEISIQNEQLEQLNLEYQKQAHTIIHHQNTILAKNRDLNRIIEHLSKIEDTDYQTLLTEIDHVVNTAKVVSSLIKVALYQCNDGTKCEEILASFAQLLHCTDENELIHYLPDFIIIDHNFKGHFNPQISHIPLIRIIPTDGLQNAFHQLADITIIESELQTALPKQIQMYTNRRHLINEQFASTPSTNSSDLTLHAADQEFIDTTILVIEKHLSNNELDSELLCHELNLSRTVLYSKIKQLTGQGVHEFIKMIRVKKSVDLLKARKLNITQIAYEVGFSSPSYYNRCFVKQFGVPPKEYLSKL